MADSKHTVSRRGFVAACSAVAAGLAVPGCVKGAGGRGTSAGWADYSKAQLAALRTAYLAEVERFAETLRPRFESGELRGNNDADYETYDKHGTELPLGRLEKECTAHFGLEVKRGVKVRGEYEYETLEGDEAAAHAILAVSPYTEATEENHTHVCYHAMEAAAWDVLSVARAKRYYTPTPDETVDLLDTTRCQWCGDDEHGDSPCTHGDCRCGHPMPKVSETPAQARLREVLAAHAAEFDAARDALAAAMKEIESPG